jgi:tetratricopeptide (TPR) repeat protein
MPEKRSFDSTGLVYLSMAIAIAGPVTAQEPDITAIGQLIERGNHAAALLEAQKLEAAAKAQFGISHTSYAYALNILATVYLTQEEYDEAEGLYRRAMAIRAKVLGDDHPDVAHSLTILSSVYSLQRKFAEAEGLLRRALEIQEKALGKNHVTKATTLGLLASVCLWQGKDQEADALRERAKFIFDNVARGAKATLTQF